MTTKIENAQLYWDDQDPAAEGWWLRWTENGSECGTDLDGDRDADLETLAELALEICDAEEVSVYAAGRENVCLRARADGRSRWL